TAGAGERRPGHRRRRRRQRHRSRRAHRAGAARRRAARPRPQRRPLLAARPATLARMSGALRVLVVDDDALVRGGLTMMLDGVHGISVVAEAADGDEVSAAADEHTPAVVLTTFDTDEN